MGSTQPLASTPTYDGSNWGWFGYRTVGSSSYVLASCLGTHWFVGGNAALSNLAVAHPADCIFVDPNITMGTTGATCGLLAAYQFGGSSVHFNDTGHQVLAQIVWQGISQWMLAQGKWL